MIISDIERVKEQLIDVKNRTVREFERRKPTLKKDNFKVYEYIINTLNSMINQYAHNNILPKYKRHGYLAWYIVDSAQSVIDHGLCGKIMDVEEEYIKL